MIEQGDVSGIGGAPVVEGHHLSPDAWIVAPGNAQDGQQVDFFVPPDSDVTIIFDPTQIQPPRKHQEAAFEPSAQPEGLPHLPLISWTAASALIPPERLAQIGAPVDDTDEDRRRLGSSHIHNLFPDDHPVYIAPDVPSFEPQRLPISTRQLDRLERKATHADARFRAATDGMGVDDIHPDEVIADSLDGEVLRLYREALRHRDALRDARAQNDAALRAIRENAALRQEAHDAYRKHQEELFALQRDMHHAARVVADAAQLVDDYHRWGEGGVTQAVDVGGKVAIAHKGEFDIRHAQDLAEREERAREAFVAAQEDLASLPYKSSPGGQWLAIGAPVAGCVTAMLQKADTWADRAPNPLVRGALRWGTRAGAIVASGLFGAVACGAGSNAARSPDQTLPPPGETQLGPPGVSDTVQMITVLPSWLDLTAALSAHGVDSSGCTPDALGGFVEDGIPVESVDRLLAMNATAVNHTPEPDGLVGMTCGVVQDTKGDKQAVIYFTGEDADGNGQPDLFVASRSGVLLPAAFGPDGKLDVVPPPPEAPPEGATPPLTAPDYPGASGGETPPELDEIMRVANESIAASLAAQDIDPESVTIDTAWRGSGDRFRIGNGITTPDRQVAYYPRFDDTGELAWRPDLRLSPEIPEHYRPWHWDTITLPAFLDGLIELVYDDDNEQPQLIAVSRNRTRMLAWFDYQSESWRTPSGEPILPPPTEAPPPPPAPEPGPTSCLDEKVQQSALISSGIDLQTALDAYATEHPRHREVTYNGFFTGPWDDYKWYVGFPALLVGGTSSNPGSPTFVSLEGRIFDTPEGQIVGQKGDFVQCLFVARPDTEAIIPIVVALKLQGIWSPIAVFFDGIKVKQVAMGSPEAIDAFIAQNSNKPMYPSIVLRYQSPDTLGVDTDLTWEQGGKAAQPLIMNNQGYLARFTQNPALLGENKIGPPKSCPPNTLCQSEAGEAVVFDDLVGKLDPHNDLGLISPWIPFGRVP